ncbi:MAG: PqqD family protein [Acutalibacteraceae bacterium]|nr:PqqD family protein [Acutalibacteraceae bacterium]
MKLKDTFVTHQIDDTYIMLDTEKSVFNGVINGNKSASFIVECLKVDTTKEEIIEKMLNKYDAPADIITEDVNKIIDILKKLGAINE